MPYTGLQQRCVRTMLQARQGIPWGRQERHTQGVQEVRQACYHQKKLWAQALALELELELELEMEKKKEQGQGWTMALPQQQVWS